MVNDLIDFKRVLRPGSTAWSRLPNKGASAPERKTTMNKRLNLTRAFVTTTMVIVAGHGSGNAMAEPGHIAWRVHFDGLYTDFEPVVAPDGTIVTGNADFVTAVNPDGSIRWRTLVSARQGETSVGPDGTVYAVSGTSIIALDAFDGQVLWTFSGPW